MSAGLMGKAVTRDWGSSRGGSTREWEAVGVEASTRDWGRRGRRRRVAGGRRGRGPPVTRGLAA